MRYLLTAVVLVAGCAAPTDTPGDPGIHAVIADMNDCSELQASFNEHMSNVESLPVSDERRDAELAYADTVDERMEEVGCYG